MNHRCTNPRSMGQDPTNHGSMDRRPLDQGGNRQLMATSSTGDRR